MQHACFKIQSRPICLMMLNMYTILTQCIYVHFLPGPSTNIKTITFMHVVLTWNGLECKTKYNFILLSKNHMCYSCVVKCIKTTRYIHMYNSVCELLFHAMGDYPIGWANAIRVLAHINRFYPSNHVTKCQLSAPSGNRWDIYTRNVFTQSTQVCKHLSFNLPVLL